MKVTAIIPAYNEEQTIGDVVQAIAECGLVDGVIVVSDGSEDQTTVAAAQHGAQVIDLEQNVGKGGAMKIGADSAPADTDVFLFIDADLIGLTCDHVAQLLAPVLDQGAHMSVGVFEDGRFATDLAQKIAPFLSGQRAICRQLFYSVPEVEDSRYGIEMAVSRFADKNKERYQVVVVTLKDLSQIMKEEKQGYVRGLCSRLRMYWEIVRNIRF